MLLNEAEALVDRQPLQLSYQGHMAKQRLSVVLDDRHVAMADACIV